MVAAVGAAGVAAEASSTSEAGSVKALVDIIKKEEVTVTIDLFTKINVSLSAVGICMHCVFVSLLAFAESDVDWPAGLMLSDGGGYK